MMKARSYLCRTLHILFTIAPQVINYLTALPVSMNQGTKEAGTTFTLKGLINTTLQHSYSLVITVHYTEAEPRETITLQYLFWKQGTLSVYDNQCWVVVWYYKTDERKFGFWYKREDGNYKLIINI